MKYPVLLRALFLVLPVSTLVVACGSDRENSAREALEREALERDLEMALEPDTTVQPQFTDVAIAADSVAPAAAPVPVPEPPRIAAPPTPQPSPASAPAPAPRVRERAPARPAPAEPVREEAVAEAPREPARTTRTAPSGTRFAVSINEQLSTRSTAAGESFTATLTEAITDGDGNVVIPAGATVRGRVVESQHSGRAGEQPVLRIAFESISSGGRSYPIEGSVAGSVPTRRVARDSRTEQAAKVAGGAAAGAVLGRVLGRNTKSTVGGAVIGAAAGTAVAIGTAEVDAVISEGTVVDVRLDGPVSITR